MRYPAGAVPWLVSTIFLAGCSTPVDLSYVVHPVFNESTGVFQVSLEMKNPPSSPLTLRAFASIDTLGLSDVSADTMDGAPLEVTMGSTIYETDRGKMIVPQVRIRGDFGSGLTCRYAVRPGYREGDPHIGHTGRSHGYLGTNFALITGKNLFLLPTTLDNIKDLRVQFTLPAGWSAVTPWARSEGAWTPGIEGKYRADDLISASIALGLLELRIKDIRGSRYVFALRDRTPDPEIASTMTALETAIDFVHTIFHRGPSPNYTIVAGPETPLGDDIEGSSWADGQGGTMVPITSNRLHLFTERLLGAYMRDGPNASRLSDTHDYWLVDGLTAWYSWRAVVEAGWLEREELTRQLALDYLDAMVGRSEGPNLEQMYDQRNLRRTNSESIAPFVVDLIDIVMRQTSHQAISLDQVVPAVFSQEKAKSFWPELRKISKRDYSDVHEAIVRGRRPRDLSDVYAVAAPEPLKEGARAGARSTLVIAFSGRTLGYLENCGCKGTQAGGVARRAGFLRALRVRHPSLIALDAGDVVSLPKIAATEDILQAYEQGLYLRLVEQMAYDAAAVGVSELARGPEYFRDRIRRRRIPFLCSNVTVNERPLTSSHVILRPNGVRVGVIGVVEPPTGYDSTDALEEHMRGLRTRSPRDVLNDLVPRLRPSVDLVVALGRITPRMVREIADNVDPPDIVISSEFRTPVLSQISRQVEQEDENGFVGKTLVLYTRTMAYGMGTVFLSLDDHKRIAGGRIEDVTLDERIPEDAATRHELDAFYDRVGRLQEAQLSVPPLFKGDTRRLSGRYAGADRCTACHQAEHEQWLTTPHSIAFKTLLDRHRHFQPRCVVCHVVGYGTPHGYRMGGSSRLENVQCEVCHGPGADHIDSPSRQNIQREVPEGLCLECHDDQHSDNFQYRSAHLMVVHVKRTETSRR